MKNPWNESDLILYKNIFEIANELKNKKVEQVIMYLEKEDSNFTEQENIYGKSLLNGVDLITNSGLYSIGNRFIDVGYGLQLDKVRTKQVENVSETKDETVYPFHKLRNEIQDVKVYWCKIPFQGATGFYPQEVEIIDIDGELMLFSSMEVNGGNVNTPFTNELLLVESIETYKELKLGKYGDAQETYCFNDFNEFLKFDEKEFA